MAKGDNPDFWNQVQQLFQNPQAMQALTGAMQGGQNGGNPITGNPQNFMAGMRKTMGNPNPVNPYGFVPPNMRSGQAGAFNPVATQHRATQPAPQMNMPGSNTGFQGNQNTGITGGMNRTYGLPTSYQGGDQSWQSGGQIYNGMTGRPMGPVGGSASDFLKQSPQMGGQINNPYAPKAPSNWQDINRQNGDNGIIGRWQPNGSYAS